MDSVLLLGQMASKWNQGLKAEDSDGVLVILRKLSEDWEEFLDHMLFLKLS